MDDKIFDQIHEVDLKETMESSYICLLYTSDAADD